MRRAILESPYAGDIRANRYFAESVCRYLLLKKEINCFASHLFYPHFLNEHDTRERQIGIDAGLQWAEGTDLAIFVLPTLVLSPSRGMRYAHLNHIAAQREILYGIFDSINGSVENRHWLTRNQFFHAEGWREGLKQTLIDHQQEKA